MLTTIKISPGQSTGDLFILLDRDQLALTGGDVYIYSVCWDEVYLGPTIYSEPTEFQTELMYGVGIYKTHVELKDEEKEKALEFIGKYAFDDWTASHKRATSVNLHHVEVLWGAYYCGPDDGGITTWAITEDEAAEPDFTPELIVLHFHAPAYDLGWRGVFQMHLDVSKNVVYWYGGSKHTRPPFDIDRCDPVPPPLDKAFRRLVARAL